MPTCRRSFASISDFEDTTQIAALPLTLGLLTPVALLPGEMDQNAQRGFEHCKRMLMDIDLRLTLFS